MKVGQRVCFHSSGNRSSRALANARFSCALSHGTKITRSSDIQMVGYGNSHNAESAGAGIEEGLLETRDFPCDVVSRAARDHTEKDRVRLNHRSLPRAPSVRSPVFSRGNADCFDD